MVPNKFETIIERFYHWEKTTPDKVFLRQPKGDDWKEITWAQAGQVARRMVSALSSQGLKKGDHVAIYSKNCYHWVLADLAIMMGGYVSVPLYSSLTGPQLEEVVSLGDVKAIFTGKLDKWDAGHEAALGGDILAIKFPHYEGFAESSQGLDWDKLIAEHPPMTESYVPKLDDLWTIKFTSGTTGTPKGVMHTHETAAQYMQKEQDAKWIGAFEITPLRFLSYLPLNHVGERMGVELPAIWGNGTISFVENLASFARNIQNTQPTVFFGVPRIWTNLYLGILAKMPKKQIDLMLAIPIVKKAVATKIRTGIGMRDLKVAATGAAITPAFIKAFYKKLDIHLVEAYGMTEVCGAISNSVDPDTPLDSVGAAAPGCEVKIDPETQEILMKSHAMMTGYYKRPEKTHEVLDKDGWLRSGDRGAIDDKGYIRVIGRVKDAFKTSKGSFITPNPLEEFLAKNAYIDQICVVGLGIPQPIALLNLSPQGAAADKPDVESALIETLEQLNATRVNYERISTLIIQSENWTPENGCLTPTMKVKRFTLDDRFSHDYRDWHEAPENVIWT